MLIFFPFAAARSAAFIASKLWRGLRRIGGGLRGGVSVMAFMTTAVGGSVCAVVDGIGEVIVSVESADRLLVDGCSVVPG